MSNRKFVVHRTTTLTGKPVIYFAAALAVAAGACAPVAARAQAASDIYKKMSDVYSFAKSYQGTIVRTRKGKTPDGKPASRIETVHISFKAPNKYLVNNTVAVSVGGKNQKSDQMMTTDGKALYMYSAEKKMYQRGQILNENILGRFFALLNPVNGFALLPDTTVNGRAAFAIKPNMPTKGTPEQLANAKKIAITIMIDKQNYQFLKMTIVSANGSDTQAVNGQTVNGPVPDNIFSWTPPAGYKEIKPQPAQGGAMPGRAPGQ